MRLVDLLTVALVAAMLVLQRFVPLRGARRAAVILLRAGGLVCLALALRGCVSIHRQERPRHLVYLVDQSASIDAAQTEWMARRLASLEAIRPPGISRAILAFGADTRLVVPPGRGALTDVRALEERLVSATLERAATNLEAALLASQAVMPPQEHSRVILLSDGRQTAGDIEQVLGYARRLGLEVYPVTVPPTEPTGVVWERLAVPSVVQQGSSVPVTLLIGNMTTTRQPAEITVMLNGIPMARRRAQLSPGWRVVSLSVPALKTGTMALEVSVASGKAQQQRPAVVEVEGPPQVLVVLEKPTQLPVLATALKRRGIEVAVATPQDLPNARPGESDRRAGEAGRLLDYDAVLFYHLPKSSLSQTQVDALQAYVERFGGGVVMVGLGGVLDQEISQDAPLDRLLPVTFEAKGLQEATRRVCMVMAIDRSASMMGPRIAATKRAAVELVKQLAPEDLVGVLAFDTVPYVVVEVQPAGEVTSTLIEKLVRLKSTGGTDILPALAAAQERLEWSQATVKHIILLSDGNTPFDAKAYRQLTDTLREQHITISTIGIGAAFVNTDFLQWLATATGGRFYQMSRLDELPQLVAQDTHQTLGELPFTEGYFHPQAAQPSEWFPDITEWPALKGFLTTTAKPGARVEVEIPQAEAPQPLLAQWALGLGRVVVFASDADVRWSPQWIRWDEFERVWAQVVRRVMRPRPTEAVFVWVDDQQHRPHVVVEGRLTAPTAELVSQDGTTIPLALVQVSPFRFRAAVDQLASGWYQLLIRSGAATSDPSETMPGAPSAPATFVKRWIQLGHVSGGPEQRHLPPDEALLRRIAQATQGLFDVPDRAFVPTTDWVEQRVPFRGWLLPLVLLLLLADVALRGRSML